MAKVKGCTVPPFSDPAANSGPARLPESLGSALFFSVLRLPEPILFLIASSSGVSRGSFRDLLTASVASRNLPGAMILDKNTTILEAADTGIQQKFTPPSPEFLTNVNESEPEIAVLPKFHIAFRNMLWCMARPEMF